MNPLPIGSPVRYVDFYGDLRGFGTIQEYLGKFVRVLITHDSKGNKLLNPRPVLTKPKNLNLQPLEEVGSGGASPRAFEKS